MKLDVIAKRGLTMGIAIGAILVLWNVASLSNYVRFAQMFSNPLDFGIALVASVLIGIMVIRIADEINARVR